MKNFGFTLLETIIYCALFSVLMTSSLLTVFALMDTTEVTKNQTALVAEALFVNQKLTWVFMNASQIELVHSQTIKITRPDLQAESPLLVEFKNNTVYLSRGLSAPSLIVNPRFHVSLESLVYVDSQLSIRYRLNETKFQFNTYVR